MDFNANIRDNDLLPWIYLSLDWVASAQATRLAPEVHHSPKMLHQGLFNLSFGNTRTRERKLIIS